MKQCAVGEQGGKIREPFAPSSTNARVMHNQVESSLMLQKELHSNAGLA